MTSRTAIGLDIGSRHVKAVQLERAHGEFPWRLAAGACFPRPAAAVPIQADELRTIASVLDRRGFRGNRVIVPVPAEKLIGGVLDVPSRTAAVPIEQIARMELARTSRCAPDSFEMGFWDLPSSSRANRKPQVMAVGCAHQEADAVIDSFSAGGLDVVALDVRSSALVRAAAPLCGGDQSLFAILDLGWGSAMMVLTFAGSVVFTRTLPDAGTRTLHESLRSRLGLDADVVDYFLNEPGVVAAGPSHPENDLPTEARNLLTAYVDSLVQELKVSVSYLTQEYPDAPLSGLLLSGSNAGLPHLSGYMKNALGLEARVVAPSQFVECPPTLLESACSPALMAAVGLAQFKAEDPSCGT